MTAPRSEYKYLTNFLHEQAAAAGVPLNGTFEVTGRCNLACRMCYIRQGAGDLLARSRELSAAQWLSLAEQATAEGMLFLLLTGGEIFLRPDFLQIYEPLTVMGLNLTLYSNGTLVTPAIARRLGMRPPNRLEVTLYGASPETYAAVTGSAEAFHQALRGIDLLHDAGVTLAIKATLTRRNVQDLEAIRALAHARNLPLKTGWMLTERVDGAPCAIEDERLPLDEVMAMEEADAETRAAWAAVDPAEAIECDPMYCHAGKAAFSITPEGTMGPCMDLPLPAARPLEVGFRPAWDAVRAYTRTVQSPEECLDCAVRSYCPSCPARNYVATRSVTSPDRHCCAIAHARQARFHALR